MFQVRELAPSSADIAGRALLLFAAHHSVISPSRLANGADHRHVDRSGGRRHPSDGALNLTSPDLYSGRVILTDNGPALPASIISDHDGTFAGRIIDPVPLAPIDGDLRTAAVFSS